MKIGCECHHCGKPKYLHPAEWIKAARDQKREQPHIYCDNACVAAYRRRTTRVRITCAHCGRVFEQAQSRTKKYCSRECQYAMLRVDLPVTQEDIEAHVLWPCYWKFIIRALAFIKPTREEAENIARNPIIQMELER